ncbi:DEAD/DEAH box helicase [Lysinibacillus antri]|uniref:Helicase SNF n=1 Tax=Lysinibacillus antri TaxID=2498145 RepID=A0A3S0RJC1_9BACI|nr:DEAD/DEAH box helicase [Lysinibacillus antri]RUL52250.1 helicase SNF [Lysinibacillus antri]
MEVKLNRKIIEKLCGTVSFKRGDSFFRGNKVELIENDIDFCLGLVKGNEDFHVHIKKDSTGTIQTSCSCSSLLQFDKACQHVAAVLIAIYERQGAEKLLSLNIEATYVQANDFMTIFQTKQTRKSGHQMHFENREIVDLAIQLRPFENEDEQYLFEIQLKIGNSLIQDSRGFLENVYHRNNSRVTTSFTYDPMLHCFSKETDAIVQQLTHLVRDEMVLMDSTPQNRLLIVPSSFEGLFLLLLKANTTIEEYGTVYKLQMQDGPPPLQFHLRKIPDGHYQLHIHGFEKLKIFPSYHLVLSEGLLYNLTNEDSEILQQLKQMVAKGANHVSIASNQLNTFMETVVPNLKRLGHVEINDSILREMKKTSLVAKLYLDRLKHRLLAGLEFEYDHVVIQPLENNDVPIGNMVIRDVEKEAAILKMMEDSGFTQTEGGYYMQNEELEYHFLYHVLPKLHPLAQIYMTTAVRTRLVKKDVFPKIQVKVQKERTDWIEFKFEMTGIKDDEIKEILAALKVKQKYYRLPNGSLLSLETKEMEEIQRFLNEIPAQDDEYEASFNLPILNSLKFLDLIEESEVFSPEQSFRQLMDQLLHPETLKMEVPEYLDSILRDYQKHGYRWMKTLANYGFGGVLADDMGLGKTLQSITFIVSELESIRQQQKPILIVCPSSLTYNWLDELLSFAPEVQAIVIDGKKQEREKLLQDLQSMDVVITSYPLLRRDRKWYESQNFHTVFFDEAQAFKNPMTQTARTVKKIQADNRFALTGTPVENSLEELWSIYYVVFPQLFQKLEDYTFLPRKVIARRVRPFLLRRTKKEVLTELPGKQETLELSELLPEQKKLYVALLAKLRHDTLKHLDKETFASSRIRILAGLTRLRQVCCHPALFVEGYTGGSAKFEQLLQILEESQHSGRRVLIFSQFTKMLEMIGKELVWRNQSYFYLDGKTPADERVELCNRFNYGEREVFLISLKAGGTGLNLTGADTVILYDLWWNPAVEEQAADRAYRMGQKNVVEVIKLISRGTIEEKIHALQEKKRDLVTDILHPNENNASKLTEEDIREILML